MKQFTLTALSMIFAAALFSTAVNAQDWAQAQLKKSSRHREWVTMKHDGRSVETFVVYPETKDKKPVVLIIHEIFGLSDWAQELADEVAAAGYMAVAPDLLSGMAPNGGRTSDFPGDKVTEAVSHLESRSGDCRSECRRRLWAEIAGFQRQTFCWRILLGRRTDLSVRDQSRGSLRRVCFLWAAAG